MPKARNNQNDLPTIMAESLMQSHSRDRLRNRHMSILLAGAVLWTAVTCGSATNNARAIETPPPARPLTPSTCDMPDLHDSTITLEQAAQKCLDDRHGKVALVGYGTHPPDLATAANESERILADGTDDLVKVDIVPIPASKEALERLKQLNPNGCIEQDVLSSAPSAIAKETMDLGDYSAVVGVVNMPRCDKGASGDAYSKHFLANAYGVETVPLRGKNFLPETHDPADVIAHELGHIYGLGHADMIDATESPDLDYRMIEGGFYPDEAQKSIIDLTPPSRPLSHKEYLGYGAYDNLMGRHTGDLYLSTAQRWQMEWPERVLGMRPDRQKIINWSTVDIEHTLDEDRDFATLILNEPVTFTVRSQDGSTQSNTFDKLVFEPLDKNTNIASVYFATSKSIHILELGHINLGTTSYRVQTVKISDQIVRVENTADEGLILTDLAPLHR